MIFCLMKYAMHFKIHTPIWVFGNGKTICYFEHTWLCTSTPNTFVMILKYWFWWYGTKNEFKEAIFCCTPLSNNICRDEFTLKSFLFFGYEYFYFLFLPASGWHYLLTSPHHLFLKVKYSILLLNSFPNSFYPLINYNCVLMSL